MRFALAERGGGILGDEEEEFGSCGRIWGGSLAVPGSSLSTRQRFSTAGTARPFLIVRGSPIGSSNPALPIPICCY